MRPALMSLLAALMVAQGAFTTGAQAQEIERFRADGAVPLSKGVIIPPNSAVFFLSGQIASPIDPARPLSPALTRADMGDTKTQTISALGKVKALLADHGYKLSDLVKVTVFLVADPALGGWDFAGMNEGFKQFFGTAENPNTVARSTVEVKSVAYPTFFVEIEAIAAKAPGKKGK